MSNTIIVPFAGDGEAVKNKCEKIPNSRRSGFAIWIEIEKRYLPPYVPEYAEGLSAEQFEQQFGSKLTRVTSFDHTALKELWNLINNQDIPYEDRVILATTLDGVIVRKEELEQVICAFRNFDANTSLPEQADALEKLSKDPDVSAIAWDQNDIVDSHWFYDSNCYNYNKDHDHWFLFDEIAP